MKFRFSRGGGVEGDQIVCRTDVFRESYFPVISSHLNAGVASLQVYLCDIMVLPDWLEAAILARDQRPVQPCSYRKNPSDIAATFRD